MWSNGEDFNSEGNQVRLYQPILYGRKAEQHALTTSFVGGKSEHVIAICSVCQRPLHLIAQLFAPAVPVGSSKKAVEQLDRTFQVFACNRSECIQSLFTSNEESQNKLCYGGKGVITCIRLDSSKIHVSKIETPTEAVHSASNLESNDVEKSSNNDWDAEDSDLGDLADKLAELESGKIKMKQPKIEKKNVAIHEKESNSPTNEVFPCYELHSLHEPPSTRNLNVEMDMDDVGITGSDDKIQKLLEKYMAEEEDEDILQALRGSVNGGSTTQRGRRGERDERLSAEDRILLTFTDRLKRCPKQVLRCAYGGEPLWSIPIITLTEYEQREKQYQKSANSNRAAVKRKIYGVKRPIPHCAKCGSSRIFEFQILPSILHVLNVDKMVYTNHVLRSLQQDGAMDWGNIAIYACPNGCSSSEEYCIIQDSIDELPILAEQVSSPLNAKAACFDEDDDDDFDDEQSDGKTEDFGMEGVPFNCDEDDDDW